MFKYMLHLERTTGFRVTNKLLASLTEDLQNAKLESMAVVNWCVFVAATINWLWCTSNGRRCYDHDAELYAIL